jgi:hypothetical protein
MDADGRLVPDIAADAFCDVRVTDLSGRAAAAAKDMRALTAVAEDFGASLADAFPWVRWADVAAALRLAAEEVGEAAAGLARGLPHRLCRGCGGHGCAKCKGGGHLPRG